MATLKVKDGGLAKAVSFMSVQDATALRALIEEIERRQLGKIDWFGTKEVPDKHLLCDGRELIIAEHEDLYDAIGDIYGTASSTDKFKIPNLIGKFAQGAATAGTVKDAGLPEISGAFSVRGFANSGNWTVMAGYDSFYLGATTASDYVAQNINPGGSISSRRVEFRASRSNGIYGKSTTVQPPALTLLPCIRAFI